MRPLNAEDPRVLGSFSLIARLGEGGMGEVFLGWSADGALVAVKVVRAEIAHDEEFRRRFRQEVEAARRVGTAYTAAVVDAAPDETRPWLATAYVPGPTLNDAVRHGGPLPEPATWRLAAGLAEALAAIHGAGIIHRDLKPSNVLLTGQGPRVVDFGIARISDATVLTRTGAAIGTPAFMSPEQFDGVAVTPASDVFSLGSVLAFAATGTPPFGGGPLSAVLKRILSNDAVIELPAGDLRDLVVSCLAAAPGDRPSIDALRSSVSRQLGGEQAVGVATAWLPPTVQQMVTKLQNDLNLALPQVEHRWPGSAVPSQTTPHREWAPPPPTGQVLPSHAMAYPGPPGPPPKRRKGIGTAIAVTAAALCVLLGIASGLVITEILNPDPVPTLSPGPEPSPRDHTDDRQELINLLDGSEFHDCTPALDEEGDSVVAAINCDTQTSSGPTRRPLILRYADTDAMDRYLADLAEGVPSGDRGNCEKGEASTGTWEYKDRTIGRMICVWHDDRFKIVWSYDQLKILVIASDEDADELYSWWADVKLIAYYDSGG
jgi:serine/threonine protein kinase